MQQTVGMTLVLAVLAGSLSGCGQAVGPNAALARQAALTRARATEGPPARQFYERMKGHYTGSLTITGDRVTLAYPDQPAAIYDFAETARSGQVHVTIGEFQTLLPFADLMEGAADDGAGAEVLPVLLVPIALDMAAAGAQALALYWLGHRGDAFDKRDAAKAVALGMALAIVPFLGEMSALGKIVPVAAKLVAGAGGFGAREIARAAAAMSGEILDLVKYLYKLHKAKQGVESASPILGA